MLCNREFHQGVCVFAILLTHRKVINTGAEHVEFSKDFDDYQQKSASSVNDTGECQTMNIIASVCHHHFAIARPFPIHLRNNVM
jgi:hypothetical protein